MKKNNSSGLGTVGTPKKGDPHFSRKQTESGVGAPTGDDSGPVKPAREREPTVPNQQR